MQSSVSRACGQDPDVAAAEQTQQARPDTKRGGTAAGPGERLTTGAAGADRWV